MFKLKCPGQHPWMSNGHETIQIYAETGSDVFNIALTISTFPSTSFYAHKKTWVETPKINRTLILLISQKVFTLGWGRKVGVSIKAKCDKMQWKQMQRINNDVHEACDLNVHWSFCSSDETKNSGRGKHQICMARWWDTYPNLPQINTWN